MVARRVIDEILEALTGLRDDAAKEEIEQALRPVVARHGRVRDGRVRLDEQGMKHSRVARPPTG